MFDIQTIRRMNSSGTMTKAEVVEAWGMSPKDKVRRVANNTWQAISESGVERIIFHKTAVLTAWLGGAVTLRTGGWDTRTTMDRINRFGSGFGVFSEGGTWYVRLHQTGGKYRFMDGMTIDTKAGTATAPCGAMLERLPEGSASLAVKAGNLVTEAIEEWQRETDAGLTKHLAGEACRLFSIIDTLEDLGFDRTDMWDVMDPHVHEPEA